MFLKFTIGIGILFSVSRVYNFLAGLKRVDHVPGFRPLFSPLSLFGTLIPSTWWNPGLNWSWNQRHTSFFNHTHDIITMVPILLGSACYYTGSLEVMKQVLSVEGKTHLIKPKDLLLSVLLWGDSLVSANGEMWKRHRRLVAPAFTTKTYSLVWEETIATYREMAAAEGWDNKKEFVIPEINKLPMKFALIIISRCGFGLPMSWADLDESREDLGFGRSLATVCETSILRLVLPRWAYKLPIKRLHNIEHAWVSLAFFMREFVRRRKQELRDKDGVEEGDRGDLFSRLVAASDGAEKYALDEQEVIGNTFTLMFAGHETTAKVLAATLGFLALHQDEQEKGYQEVLRVLSGREPVVEDVAQLQHLLACFLEAMRIYPAGGFLSRDVSQDTFIKTSCPTEQTVILKKGSRLIIDLIAVHHNPTVFPDPDRFRPSRWYGVSEHDISMYGVGPRACIGRKFAQTEALCFLSLLLRDWKLDVVLGDGETRQMYEDRVMGNAAISGMAFGVGPVTVKFVRRE